MTEKYFVYEKDGMKNPFMHIRQKPNGEIFFRFLNTTNKKFDFHYSRHNKESHSILHWEGIHKRSKTDIKKTQPVHSITKLERIRAIILTGRTGMKKPTEQVKDFPTIMEIDASKYPKDLINIIIFLNPSIPLEEVVKITQPDQYVQDHDFNPPVLILCFRHTVNFLKLGVDMI